MPDVQHDLVKQKRPAVTASPSVWLTAKYFKVVHAGDIGGQAALSGTLDSPPAAVERTTHTTSLHQAHKGIVGQAAAGREAAARDR